MIVVTNSGPLMALAKLGLLDLLGRLYGKVYMPGAVYDEVVLRGEEGGFSDSRIEPQKTADKRRTNPCSSVFTCLPNEISFEFILSGCPNCPF